MALGLDERALGNFAPPFGPPTSDLGDLLEAGGAFFFLLALDPEADDMGLLGLELEEGDPRCDEVALACEPKLELTLRLTPRVEREGEDMSQESMEVGGG